MQTSLTELTPHTLRLEIEAPWETVAPDYADVCDAYRHAALPGFRPGHVPPAIIAQKFSREIRADAAQRSAARLTRDAIREKNLRTLGGVAITDAHLAPSEPFRCTAELTRRPEITLPDYHAFLPEAPAGDNETRRDEISTWLLANSRFSHHIPDANGPSGDEQRLILITQEIAAHDGVTLDERQFETRLAGLAAQAGIPPATYRANLEKADALTTLRDLILAETVLDYLTTRTG